MGQRFPLSPEVSLLQNAFRSEVLFVTSAVAARIFDCFRFVLLDEVREWEAVIEKCRIAPDSWEASPWFLIAHRSSTQRYKSLGRFTFRNSSAVFAVPNILVLTIE
jgi:hypothetical protein